MSDAKKKILARRAQFVAAALAGLSTEACHKEPADKPQAAETPQPCLSVFTPPPDPPEAGAAVPPAYQDPQVGAGLAPDSGIGPPPPAPPHPCLRMAPPPKKK